MQAINDTAAHISWTQASHIAADLREAGMNVAIKANGPGPIFTNCTGTQVLATMIALVGRGVLSAGLLQQDWQTVSFEESTADGHWSSIELTWTD